MKLNIHFFRSLFVLLHRAVDTGFRTVFGIAIYRRQLKKTTILVFFVYVALVVFLMWLSAGRPQVFILSSSGLSVPATLDALGELSKSYSSIVFDLLFVAILGISTLIVYRHGFLHAVKSYKQDRLNEIETNSEFCDQVVVFKKGVKIHFKFSGGHFEFPEALKCTIESSALNSDAIFQGTQGGFDLAKITLVNIVSVGSNTKEICLGTTSYRSANLSHYWSFVPIASESSDETNSRVKSLFDLTAMSQINFVKSLKWNNELTEATRHAKDQNDFRPCVSNMLGVSAFVRLNCIDGVLWLMRERTGHVAADQRDFCVGVAGAVDVYPEFALYTSSQESIFYSQHLLAQEYEDEVRKLLSPHFMAIFSLDVVDIVPLGLIFTVESNFQPELYFSIDAKFEGSVEAALGSGILSGMESKKGEIHVFEDLSVINRRLRARDRLALSTFCI